MKTLKYFRQLADRQKAVILITHDIDLALNVADRITIFYGGSLVETASVEDFHRGLEALRHPYTKALFNALPQNEFKAIDGSQPYGLSMEAVCLFAPRRLLSGLLEKSRKRAFLLCLSHSYLLN